VRQTVDPSAGKKTWSEIWSRIQGGQSAKTEILNEVLLMKHFVTSTLLVLLFGAPPMARTKLSLIEDMPWIELYNAIAAMGPSRASAAEKPPGLGAQEPNSSPLESHYILADPDRFGMNITVAKSDLGDHYHLQVYFTVPEDESIVDVNLITIYGLQMQGGRRSDLPPGTFPSVRGHWKSGDRVTLQVDLPKKFADPDKGWNLTFCVGRAESCSPSPNLLKPLRPTGSVVDSLNQIKSALESYSNLRASRVSLMPLELSGNYRIKEINGCVITLVHTSTILDRNGDGSESTTTALIDLANLTSDAKVSERVYEYGWKPSSRWVLSDAIINGRVPISTESVVKGFPGRSQVATSKSHQIEIEFMDGNAAEVLRKMLIREIVACGEAKSP